MNNRPVSDEFDVIVRHALEDVSDAVRPERDLATRLITNAKEGRPAVVRRAARRQAKRWALPLLAAASIAILAAGGAIAANLLADDHHAQPQHSNSVPTPNPSPTVTKPPAVPHFRAADVYFSDAQHGWALGDALCDSGSKTDCPTLLVTTDGGAAWHPLSVPRGLVSSLDMTTGSCNTNGGIAGPCVNQVLFATESDGYLWGLHEFYWTTDGGRTWTRETDPVSGEPGNYEMVVAGSRAIRLAPNQQCSAGCPGEIETAPVGSADWQLSTPAAGEIGYYTSGLDVVGDHVLLFAGETATNTSTGIWRSGDGGRSWHHVAQDVCGVPRDINNDRFMGTGSFAADNGALVVNCLGARARVAAPGSTDFTAVPGPAGVRGSDVVAAESEDVMTAVHASRRDQSGLSHSYTFYRTTDGGSSWQVAGTISALEWKFRSGSFGYGMSLDRTGWLVTSDGGRTWTPGSFSA